MVLDKKLERAEDESVSSFPLYVEALARNIEAYHMKGVNPGQVQIHLDEHIGKTHPQVNGYFKQMEDRGILELQTGVLNKTPMVYSITDYGREVLDAEERKNIGDTHWVGLNDNRITIYNQNESKDINYMSSEIAENVFFSLDEKNIDSLLEN